jgi:hypothetical protein
MATELPGLSGRTPQPAAQVAVAPFTVEHDSAGVLRAAADSTLERLARALTTNGVTVAHLRELSDKNLHTARPARWAVLGKLKREKGTVLVELRLMDVEAGEELKSYFNSYKDPREVPNIGDAVAGRIAAFVKEQT